MRYLLLLCLCLMPAHTNTQTQSPVPKQPDAVYLLRPAHVFDGQSAQLHDDWVVLVRGEKIEAVGPDDEINAPAEA